MATTTDLQGLLDGIKDLITANVLGQQTTTISAGQDEITVATTCAYADGDYCLIYSTDLDPYNPETEAHERQVMPTSDTTLWLSSPIPDDISNARVIRQVAGQYLRNIYVGDPPLTPDFPCLTISGKVDSVTPYALGGTANVVYLVQVCAFTSAPDYETATRSARTIANAVETALTHRYNPSPDPCRAIYKCLMLDVTEDAENNQGSTLKAVKMLLQYEEMIQQFIGERPILESV